MNDSTLFINGEWVAQEKRLSHESINPATKKVIGHSSLATKEDVDTAVNAACEAYSSWKKTSIVERKKHLDEIILGLQERKDELARKMTLEMGKVLKESYAEVETVIQFITFIKNESKALAGEIALSARQNRTIKMIREPLGVVACITPWNFPIALASYKIFSALIAGNTVVWKPASEVALTAKLFIKIINESTIPDGVINLVTGSGSAIGGYLSEHERVNVVTFTGSTEVGKNISKLASNTLKRVSLELGGKNAVIVLRDANLRKAVNGIIQSAFATTGQRCTAASRVIVDKEIEQELISMLVEKVEKMKIGDGLNKENDIGPIINEKQLRITESYVAKALEEGGELETGGEKVSDLDGYFYKPTLISNVESDDTIAQEEIFGPVVAVIGVESFEEAMKVNNSTEYGLSTSIYTKSLSYANRAAQESVTGLVYINDGTSNAEIGVAFGGMKMSGNGHREVSAHSFDVMTEWKSIYTNFEDE